MHSTVWIPGHVDFNESLANFIGVVGAQRFAKFRLGQCGANDIECQKSANSFLDQTEQRLAFEFELTDFVGDLYGKLDELYKSSVTSEAKLTQRKVIFEQSVAALRAKYPAMQAFRAINNAEIIQFKLYLTELRKFDALYKKYHEDMPKFLGEMRAIADATTANHGLLPFTLLDQALQE